MVKSFIFSFGETLLDTDEIWPDGDAPENPTAGDVVNAMRSCSSGVGRIVTEWNLFDEIKVTAPDGTAAVFR